MNIPIRTEKPKFLSPKMLARARETASYLAEEKEEVGVAVMLNLLVSDIEAYREAFNGAAITLNHAGGMLKRNDNELREASRSLALVQLKLSVLFDAAKDALEFLDHQIQERRYEAGIEGQAALHAIADELRAAIEVARRGRCPECEGKGCREVFIAQAETKIGEKIKTHHEPPSIPDRDFDWTAVTDNYDGEGSPIGYGRTEEAAIEDLVAEIEDRRAA